MRNQSFPKVGNNLKEGSYSWDIDYMAKISEATRNQVVALDIREDHHLDNDIPHNLTTNKCKINESSSICLETVHFVQQLMAELLGTYLLMLIGFASLVVNINMDKIMTFPGIAILWVLDVIMVYTVGHVSGAHFNPAVTIGLAASNKFPCKWVPAYICSQLLGSTLASGTLRLMFTGKQLQFVGTVPSGSYMQSLSVEFLITFYLMFSVSGVAFDNRAPKELAGLVVGGIITVSSLFAGPITGASMNPAISLGPAIVSNCYRGIWIYILGPIAGAISGGWAYNILSFSDKSLGEAIKRVSWLKQSATISIK